MSDDKWANLMLPALNRSLNTFLCSGAWLPHIKQYVLPASLVQHGKNALRARRITSFQAGEISSFGEWLRRLILVFIVFARSDQDISREERFNYT
jgi:hypothetical protein